MESSGSQALPAPLLGPTPDFAEMGKDQLREEARALGIQVRRRILNSKGMVNYTWRKSPDLAAECLVVWKRRRLAEQPPSESEEPSSSVRKDTFVHAFWARMFGSPPAHQSATLQEPGSPTSHIATAPALPPAVMIPQGPDVKWYISIPQSKWKPGICGICSAAIPPRQPRLRY